MAYRNTPHTDKSLFKNRLLCLMEQANVDTARKLASELYHAGLVFVKTRDNYNDPSRDESNAIGSIEKKIQKHLQTNTPSTVQGEFLVAYCKYFQCSADYLLGFTNIQSQDIEVHQICQKTGLSEQAVLKLSTPFSDDIPLSSSSECWSILIESELSDSLFCDWMDMRLQFGYSERDKCIIKALQDAIKSLNLDPTIAQTQQCRIFALEDAVKSHHLAFYGMLAKISRNISNVYEENIKSYYITNDLRDYYYNSEFEMWKSAAKNQERSSYPTTSSIDN